MAKYWNANRIRRIGERKVLTEQRFAEKEVVSKDQLRSYTAGDVQKNTQLMLEALGLRVRRRMTAMLMRDGAMSVSKLAKPFRLTLPSALDHVRTLERSGIITTHKRGRVRMCVYNERTLKELAHWLSIDGLKNLK